jgi:hypothetical protein
MPTPLSEQAGDITDNALKDRGTNAGKTRIRITLVALPLSPDAVTKRIAARVDRIVNLPMVRGAGRQGNIYTCMHVCVDA